MPLGFVSDFAYTKNTTQTIKWLREILFQNFSSLYDWYPFGGIVEFDLNSVQCSSGGQITNKIHFTLHYYTLFCVALLLLACRVAAEQSNWKIILLFYFIIPLRALSSSLFPIQRRRREGEGRFRCWYSYIFSTAAFAAAKIILLFRSRVKEHTTTYLYPLYTHTFIPYYIHMHTPIYNSPFFFNTNKYVCSFTHTHTHTRAYTIFQLLFLQTASSASNPFYARRSPLKILRIRLSLLSRRRCVLAAWIIFADRIAAMRATRRPEGRERRTFRVLQQNFCCCSGFVVLFFWSDALFLMLLFGFLLRLLALGRECDWHLSAAARWRRLLSKTGFVAYGSMTSVATRQNVCRH